MCIVKEAETLHKQAVKLEARLWNCMGAHWVETASFLRTRRVYFRAAARRERRFANMVCATINQNGNEW